MKVRECEAKRDKERERERERIRIRLTKADFSGRVVVVVVE